MTNNIYYSGRVHSNIFQNKIRIKKTPRQAGIWQLKISLCLWCNDWHGWAADTELRSSGHNAGSSSGTSHAAPTQAVFLSEKSLTTNASWKPTGGGVVWFRFTNVEKKQFICTTEQQDWTLWVITPLGGRTWGKMKAAKQQSDKTAGSLRIEGTSHSKTWLNRWALWLFHTSASLFIIFYSLCLGKVRLHFLMLPMGQQNMTISVNEYECKYFQLGTLLIQYPTNGRKYPITEGNEEHLVQQTGQPSGLPEDIPAECW